MVDSVTSNSVTITVLEKIRIATQPLSTGINLNDSGSLSLIYTGYTPITAQWRKDDIPYQAPIIQSSDTVVLNVINASLSDIGYYDCVVSNFFSSATSEKVLINVDVFPDFIINPVSTTINEFNDYTLTVDASGSMPITYQWIKEGHGNILNQTNKDYIITNLKGSDSGSYYCVATNIVGSVTSSPATINVLEAVRITTQPYDNIIDYGQNIQLKTIYTGNTPVTAQWRKNNVNYQNTIIISNSNINLDILSVNEDSIGNYSCVISNSFSSVTSRTANLDVNLPPKFILNPIQKIINFGDSYTMSVNATGANPITYQWGKENSGLILNETNKTYTISNASNNSSGMYYCIATNSIASITSIHAEIVVDVPSNIYFSIDLPSSIQATVDDIVNFVVNAVSPTNQNIQYKWLLNDNFIVPAQINSTYTLTGVDLINEGYYKCIANTQTKSITSNTCYLQISSNLIEVKVTEYLADDLETYIVF